MAAAVRYERLRTEPEEEVQEIVLEPVSVTITSVPVTPRQETDAPPAYDSVNKHDLPSYEEIAAMKEAEAAMESDSTVNVQPSTLYVEVQEPMTEDGLTLGRDSSFFGAFFVSFFFNWIGYIVAYWFSTSVAGKCGATSGFGMDLVKWGFLMKYHAETFKMMHPEYSHYLVWLPAVLVVLGWFILIRGATLYIRMKREARRSVVLSA
eukprot:Colp12_sorted_trinity150504_noHs@34493